MSTFSAIKDPDAVLDYSIDWEAWLDGDVITGSTWLIGGSGSDMSVDSDSNSNTATTVWLSGGAMGRSYDVTNRIVTSAGRTDDRTICVSVRQR